MSSLPQPEIRIGDSWDHQVAGYHLARGIYNRAPHRSAGAGFFFDMGTGKTRAAIHLLDNSRAVKKVLIVSPKKVMAVWPGQFEEHSPRQDSRRVLVPAGKTVRDRAMEIADAVEDFDGRVMDGALIFNQFKGTGRLINIDQELSVDFQVDDLRDLKL